jgi:hypothetical protein
MISKICLELEAIAVIFDNLQGLEFNAATLAGGVIKDGKFVYRTKLDSCKFKLVMLPNAEAIRERSKLLLKQSRRPLNSANFFTLRKASNFKTNYKRAAFCRVTAKGFINDEEFDNYTNYNSLYGWQV